MRWKKRNLDIPSTDFAAVGNASATDIWQERLWSEIWHFYDLWLYSFEKKAGAWRQVSDLGSWVRATDQRSQHAVALSMKWDASESPDLHLFTLAPAAVTVWFLDAHWARSRLHKCISDNLQSLHIDRQSYRVVRSIGESVKWTISNICLEVNHFKWFDHILFKVLLCFFFGESELDPAEEAGYSSAVGQWCAHWIAFGETKSHRTRLATAFNAFFQNSFGKYWFSATEVQPVLRRHKDAQSSSHF